MVTEKAPKITAFNPIVLPDKRRVMLEMVVENLPTIFSNVDFSIPAEFGTARPAAPPNSSPGTPSPYPDVVLSILDSQRREVTSLLIVEHKEPQTSLTLHLRAPDIDEKYTARAEMTYQDKILDTVEVPFTLDQNP